MSPTSADANRLFGEALAHRLITAEADRTGQPVAVVLAKFRDATREGKAHGRKPE